MTLPTTPLPPRVERRLDEASGCYYLVDEQGNVDWDTPDNRKRLLQVLEAGSAAGNSAGGIAASAHSSRVNKPAEDIVSSDSDGESSSRSARVVSGSLTRTSAPQVPVPAPPLNNGTVSLDNSFGTQEAQSTKSGSSMTPPPTKRYGTGMRIVFSSDTPEPFNEEIKKERLALALLGSHKLRLAFLETNTKARMRSNLDSINVPWKHEDDYEALLQLLVVNLSELARQMTRKDFALLLSHMLQTQDYLVEALVFPEAALLTPSDLSPPERAPPPPPTSAPPSQVKQPDFSNADRSPVRVERTTTHREAPDAAAVLAGNSLAESNISKRERNDVATSTELEPDGAVGSEGQPPSWTSLNKDLDGLIESMKKVGDSDVAIEEDTREEQLSLRASNRHGGGGKTGPDSTRTNVPAASPPPKSRSSVPVAGRPSAACGKPTSCTIS